MHWFMSLTAFHSTQFSDIDNGQFTARLSAPFPFHLCDQILEKKQLKGGRIYFGMVDSQVAQSSCDG